MLRKAHILPLLLAAAFVLPGCGTSSSLPQVAGLSGTAGAPAERAHADESVPGAQAPAAMSEAERRMALEVLALVNAERDAAGLAPLAWHEAAAACSQHHNSDMRDRDYFAHNTPEGQTPGDRLRGHSVEAEAWGENLARGYPDADSVVRAWMESPAHRDNILYPGFTHLGVGVLITDGGPYYGQTFLR